MANRAALNAAIMQAREQGYRVLCCFGCRNWFRYRGPGRPPRICDDAGCRRELAYWYKYGRRRPARCAEGDALLPPAPRKRAVLLLAEAA